MALPKPYTNNYGKIADFFGKIREGLAPEVFNLEHLRSLGFTSSHDRAMLQILKELGFLSSDSKPTPRYFEYLDGTRSKAVMATAIKDAYKDIFVLKANPQKSDLGTIAGKFRSEFNSTDAVAKTRAQTFFALLELADKQSITAKDGEDSKTNPEAKIVEEYKGKQEKPKDSGVLDFVYNIQIHLPATKDVEVYNAIFKALREHLVD